MKYPERFYLLHRWCGTEWADVGDGPIIERDRLIEAIHHSEALFSEADGWTNPPYPFRVLLLNMVDGLVTDHTAYFMKELSMEEGQ